MEEKQTSLVEKLISLREQRITEAEEYRQLSQRATQEGVGGLTTKELFRLEQLYQLSLNEELLITDRTTSESLWALNRQRLKDIKHRLEKRLPPFEKTFFDWVWHEKEKRYGWGENRNRVRPKDAPEGTEIFWQPEEIRQLFPSSHEETP